MVDIEYIKPEDLIDIVDTIRGLDYEYEAEVPDYDKEHDAIDQYFSLIERSGQSFYPDIFAKASYLFININSHYFSNGNKRLAVTSTTFFLEKNNYTFKTLSKDKCEEILQALFGVQKLDDFDGFSPINYALYNLALIVAMMNKQDNKFDDLKEKVTDFFNKTFEKK